MPDDRSTLSMDQTSAAPISNLDQTHNFVLALIRSYQEIIRNTPNSNYNAAFPARDASERDFALYKSWLAEAHENFRKASQQKIALTYASEWILDNYYIIRQALQQIEEDLPPGYYKQLPKLKNGPMKDLPRIYAIARAVLQYQHFLFDPIDLKTILIQFQETVPLTIGELWALPIFLRYGLIEFLAHALVLAIQPSKLPSLPGAIPFLRWTGDELSVDETTVSEAENNDNIANIILSLRAISEQDWNSFFETISCVEQKLHGDPAGIYAQMDFKTRDLYRAEIEALAFASGHAEIDLAEITLNLARSTMLDRVANLQDIQVPASTHDVSPSITAGYSKQASTPENFHFSNRVAHVGEYLFGEGRSVLEQRIGFRPKTKTRFKRWVFLHASALYFSSILLFVILVSLPLALTIHLPELFVGEGQSIAVLLLCFALLIPMLTISTSVVNWLITLLIPPRVLPKLDFEDRIPDPFQTIVVIPAMISSHKDIDSLVHQLELHYLRNPEPGLLFALLTDFSDANSEILPEDADLVQYAVSLIARLNTKYSKTPYDENHAKGIEEDGQEEDEGRSGSNLFYFLHRKRSWNPSERKWIGWERKRGKLHELNLLLRGAKNLSFITLTDDENESGCALQQVSFVITLDTDTILPRGAACRLAATLAHPLNRAVFDDRTGQVVAGYTVLQPRMEIHPKSTNHSWFTRLFAGDAGLDLYSLAVSDAYQDLFGEGSYVGKGIYDVDAFERSVEKRIPENTVLSHDLLEGLMGRAGLVTDITMIEDYPQNYFIQVMRQRRWVRGDWQLLPWLLRRNRDGLAFSWIDRWKMFDNLRRSLLAPALLFIFTFGLVLLPDLAGLWTGVVLLSLGTPLLTGLAHSGLKIIDGEYVGLALRPLWWNIPRWLLAIAFLPYEAYISTNAVLMTLYRLYINRFNLLQWTTAAQTARSFNLRNWRKVAWQKMSASALLALILTIYVQLGAGLTMFELTPALIFASPVLLLWVSSPVIMLWVNDPITKSKVSLSEEEIYLLRRVTRRTWGFFEQFVGPEDHWLPPDHYQEFPVQRVAHRTSPTNIGLLLTSTLAAYDLGYLNQIGLATRLLATMDTLDHLERFRGHFMNWYDTLTLQPLHPRYISTVDSGNLAASLIILARACKTLPEAHIFHWDLWQGYLDTLSNLTETLTDMHKAEFSQQVVEINTLIDAIHTEIMAVRSTPERWYLLFLKISGPFWLDLSRRLLELVEVGNTAFNLKTLGKLQEVAAQIERHHVTVQHTITELVPWIQLFYHIPARLREPQYLQIMTALGENLPFNPAPWQIHAHAEAAFSNILTIRGLLAKDFPVSVIQDLAPSVENNHEQTATEWLDELVRALAYAEKNSSLLVSKFQQIMSRADQYVNEMDFHFLYHLLRRVFHIGFNLDAGQLDQNYYDLLASEARIASIVAIAKGEVPQSHWLHLGRPVTQVEGSYVLLSWSGTMFEYLMPTLFLRSYPGTLLADSTEGAVRHQIAYGKTMGVPWGISESGFYRFDANQNYQYRAFGVPGLGFKRGLSDDLVIAPYASLMAVSHDPCAVYHNLASLDKNSMIGLYGVYESMDFTSDRLLLDETSAVVGEYMAHHQGMILMAMANFFHEEIMIQRMHSDTRIQSVELLLQEQVPQSVSLQNPYAVDVKGIQQTIAQVEIIPWKMPIKTPIPQMHILSNGSYKVLVSNMGGGYSSWRGIDLTRWQSDGALDSWGSWIYIQNLNTDQSKTQESSLWSAGHQPIPGDTEDVQVTYFAHMVVFRRTEMGVVSNMEVTVTPEDPVEIRRIHLHNNNDHSRYLRLTSYGEVILAPQAADSRHPAFNKLFIESEFIPDLNLQIFTRRPRSKQDPTIFMGHMLIVEGSQVIAQHEADRNRFIGRDRTLRNPAAMILESYLSGTTGASLDPIFALGQEIKLDPHKSANLAYLTFAAESREEIIALASRYRNWHLVGRSFHQASIAAQAWLSKQEIETQALKDALQVLSALLYPFKVVRTMPEVIAANRLGQSGLWRFGISGDYPIMLIELDNPKQVDLGREVLQVYKFLRNRQFMIDVVFLNCQKTDYGAELNGMLLRLVGKMDSDGNLNQRGGIYILYSDQMRSDERILLQTSARVLLDGANGSLSNQMPGYSIQVHHLPDFMPTRQAEMPVNAASSPQSFPLEKKDALQFFNGFGGFGADGSEYIIELPPGKTTPAPWVNVIGYPEFGFMVSEAGSQCTWAVNSGENRLTPWSNDPVCDPSGEVLYLRDEETGEVWTPTPLPAHSGQPYRITHGAGYTIFENNSHGLRQCLTLFANPEDPVKIIHLKIENTLAYPRRITATQYVEWVLGITHATSMAFIIPEYDPTLECFLASNPYNAEFGARVAFLMASKTIHGLTADRTEFLGRGGTYNSPAALHRLGLETRITAGEDPCAVLQIHLDLLPDGTEEIYFVLGQGNDREQALALAKKYHDPAHVGAAYERTRAFWIRLLGAVQVHTPEPAFDLVMNQWMLYQTLSCRLWGRTGFYQSSGAFGFRDQLQDVLALLPIEPAITRGQILNAAQHQFEAGDVMHWWHPPSGRGVRTRISDDLLWLPYTTALYIKTTGDIGILDEKIAFLRAAPLGKGEEERYSEYPQAEQPLSLLEHCLRAIEKGATRGPHGLPLIGTGDWNDGLNRVGEKGQGESIWLAWFTCDVLNRFVAVCELVGNTETALRYKALASEYATAVEQSAWDGDWYKRAFYDDGSPMGSNLDTECKIDAIAQSWSVLSGVGDHQRSRRAMQSVMDRLVRPKDRLSLLFTPPFNKTPRDPGYIKGYLPGIRENGGQYTHAATWTAWAFAILGDGKSAEMLFDLINPISRSSTIEKATVYRSEPYVVCADIYSLSPYVGRGGWTWYTGSAGWMYRLGLEAILGFYLDGGILHIDPVIPPEWDKFEIRYRFGETLYLIEVQNPEHVTTHIKHMILDGRLLKDGYIPVVDDLQEHQVVMTMGKKE
ncbi:MAG: cellobiose phosphorylase [Veillonellaceae bacterium]|nr:cellobiose phosphorylase [Veillonellaceae bacterium]